MDNKLIYYWVDCEMCNELYAFQKAHKSRIEKGEFGDAEYIFKSAAALRYYALNNESIEGLDDFMKADDIFYLDDISVAVSDLLDGIMFNPEYREYVQVPFIRYTLKLLRDCIYNKMENQEEKGK